ncbi:DUF3871 family protein [Daejeonella sp.]|uniref:DUF3871 family protein n=1 Tax=Daejeonella sp. TaxID=2805397 RepID=UPI0025B811A9|nr:DUF3871 family protein [Daejeonella sp.]
MENTLIRIEPKVELLEQPNKAFIKANSIACSLEEIKRLHHIPVFVKTNEAAISQVDFIETTANLISDLFPNEQINNPQIRLSHAVKGRLPEAKNKSASELEEHEKTIYYERMAFTIEIPSIQDNINGNRLSLTVGGVKAYNLENLNANSGSDQHFKVFIGFQNKVCTNMCVSTDGFLGDLKIKSLNQLSASMDYLFQSYAAAEHLNQLKRFTQFSLTEQQFALLVGRCRMYQHLPRAIKEQIFPESLSLTDTQIGSVVKDYYWDQDFGSDSYGTLSLWQLYNLFTGANKSSYIDSFLDRSVNAHEFVKQLQYGLDNKQTNWFLN